MRVAKNRDNVALRLVEEIGVLNAIGFANAINAYDPSLITVGGTYHDKNSFFPSRTFLASVFMVLINGLRLRLEGYDLHRVSLFCN